MYDGPVMTPNGIPINMDTGKPIATASDILAELQRLHARLDKYEQSFAAVAKALESNPMLKTLFPGGLKVS